MNDHRGDTPVTTEMEQHRPAAGALALPTVTGGSLPGLQIIEQWVQAASHARALVEPLVDSAFIPDTYKPRITPGMSPDERAYAKNVVVGNATSAVLLGLGVGLDPLTALQEIYVVYGRPTMSARIKLAIVTAAGHEIWDEKYDDDEVIVCGLRRGDPIEKTVRISTTMEQARQAGWTKNDTYAKTPRDMLWARSASRVMDRVAPDVLKGILSREDVDPDDRTAVSARVTVEDVHPAPAITRTGPPPARRVVADVEQVTPGPDPDGQITPATASAIGARFTDRDVTGTGSTARKQRIVQAITGRSVQRTQELTEREGRLVADTLADPLSVDRIENPGDYGPDGRPIALAEPGADPAEPPADDPWLQQPAVGEAAQ